MANAMRIRRGEKWWEVELVIRNEYLRKRITPVKDNSEELTVILALSAVITGVATVLIYPSLWPLRLILSILTLLSAIVSTVRVVKETAGVTDASFSSTTAQTTASTNDDN